MKRLVLILAICLEFSAVAIPVAAKGTATRITISGPDLEEGVDIIDAEILEHFNPWADQFIGTQEPFEYPPNIGQRSPYEVSFYVGDTIGEQELRYFFYYYPNPTGGPGLIYLPGTGEPYYTVNTGTIIRGKADGRWHYASLSWDQAIGQVLAEQGLTSDAAQAVPRSTVWYLLLAGFLLVIVIIFRLDPLRWNSSTARQAES